MSITHQGVTTLISTQVHKFYFSYTLCLSALLGCPMTKSNPDDSMKTLSSQGRKMVIGYEYILYLLPTVEILDFNNTEE